MSSYRLRKAQAKRRGVNHEEHDTNVPPAISHDWSKVVTKLGERGYEVVAASATSLKDNRTEGVSHERRRLGVADNPG